MWKVDQYVQDNVANCNIDIEKIVGRFTAEFLMPTEIFYLEAGRRLEAMSIYDALKQCCVTKTSISLKQLNPVIHQVFRERQEKLKELQAMYAEKDRDMFEKLRRVKEHCLNC